MFQPYRPLENADVQSFCRAAADHYRAQWGATPPACSLCPTKATTFAILTMNLGSHWRIALFPICQPCSANKNAMIPKLNAISADEISADKGQILIDYLPTSGDGKNLIVPLDVLLGRG
jgi:hypothetical protein